MIKIINKIENKLSGFTLVEALVAISILMVAVVGPLTIAQKGLSASIYSKDQMIASYLAQDAIEFIINKRDSNVVKSLNGQAVSWLGGLDDCVQIDGLTSKISKVCSVDTISGGVGGAGTTDLYIHKSGDVFVYYTHNPALGDKSKFKREVNIRRDAAKDEVLITVKVYWNGTNPDENSVTVKTYIYNLGDGGTPPTL